MRVHKRALGCLAVALALGAGPAGASPAGRIVSTSGSVRAELTYAKKSALGATGLRIRIRRGGKLLVDRPVPVASRSDVLLLGKGVLQARDLDGNGEPEVLLDLYTGGAHCCTYSLVWRYRASQNAYVRTAHSWGDVGFRLVDLDHDGRPEFQSADDRFAYAFAAYAASFFPVQIWTYRSGAFTDITRRYPTAIAADRRTLLREYRRLRTQRGVNLRGLWAAYMADSYLLGRGSAAWRAVEAALRRGELRGSPGDGWSSGRLYVTALRRFLIRLGYARA
jgi:hypothetical protein